MINLSDAIDGDMNSYALINKVAGVGSAATLSIKTNRIIGNGYQAGFIIQDQTWVTNADLLSQVKIKTYLNGVHTGDELGTPKVLSLDLIGSGDRAYLTVIPTQPFDEIQLDLSGVLDAAINTKVFGAFVRKDTDGDGIPDCVDPNPCGEPFVITRLEASCVPHPVIISYEGGKEQALYTVWDGEKEHPFLNNTANIQTTHGGKFVYTIRENGIDIIDRTVIVHAERTKWTGAVSTDWNENANWTEGVPGGCTDVVIHSLDSLITTNGIHYPILENGIYECNNIHFYPGAEVVRLDLLSYNQAWIEMKLLPTRNHLVSIPMKDTFFGDLFVGGDNNIDNRILFEPLYGNVQRKNPLATTRSWNMYSWEDNAIVYKNKLSSGFSIQLDKGIYNDDTEFVFRFAKQDSVYFYYDANGNITEKSDTIHRLSNPGRFIYENSNGGMPEYYADTLSTEGTIFVVGNPFMCHLNVAKFINYNRLLYPNLNSYVKVYDGDINNPEILPYTAKELDSNDPTASIAPMEAFFIEFASDESMPVIRFTKDMMVHGDYTTVASPQTRSASSQGNSNSSKLNLSSLKAYTRNGKGIIEAAEKVARLQVFTASGKLILEKQNVAAPVHVPLSDGVNIIKVQTENETKTFKLIK